MKRGSITLSYNVFRSVRPSGQYMSDRERKKLIRDYVWARDSYRKAVVDARRAYEELVKRGYMPEDNETPEQ
jgi:hypothetical protein